MKRDVVTTSCFAILGRILGFLIPFIIAATYGVDHETDAFFLAYAVIVAIQMVIGNAFEIAVVPYIAELSSQKRDTKGFLGSVIVRSSVAITILTVLLIVGLYTALSPESFDAPTLDLGASLLVEMLPIALFTVWTSTINGALNANKRFKIPALSPFFRSSVTIAFVILFDEKLGIHSVALGYTLGELFRFVVSLSFYVYAIGTIRLGWELEDTARTFFKSVAYQTAGMAIVCGLPLAGQIIALYTGTGKLSLYSYAERLRNIPVMLFFSGVLPVVFSHWSNEFSHKGDRVNLDSKKKVVVRLGLVAVACSVLLILLRLPVSRLVFDHGAFSEENLGPVSTIFAIMIAALAFDVMGLLCTRILIILRRDRVFLELTAARLAVAIISSIILLEEFGVYGIASGFALANGLYAAISYRKVFGRQG